MDPGQTPEQRERLRTDRGRRDVCAPIAADHIIDIDAQRVYRVVRGVCGDGGEERPDFVPWNAVGRHDVEIGDVGRGDEPQELDRQAELVGVVILSCRRAGKVRRGVV